MVPISIYNQNQEPNKTGNISLTVDSKRQLVVLALHMLFSNKKRLVGFDIVAVVVVLLCLVNKNFHWSHNFYLMRLSF